jgi:hypothetical protein
MPSCWDGGSITSSGGALTISAFGSWVIEMASPFAIGWLLLVVSPNTRRKKSIELGARQSSAPSPFLDEYWQKIFMPLKHKDDDP